MAPLEGRIKAILIVPEEQGDALEELASQSGFAAVSGRVGKIQFKRKVRNRDGQIFELLSVEGPAGAVAAFQEDIPGARLFADV